MTDQRPHLDVLLRRIWAENRPGGGTPVRFTLPLTGTPPQVAIEDTMTGHYQPLSSGG